MKLQLELRIVGYSAPLLANASTEVHLTLEKELDLPFAPYEGLRILLAEPNDEIPDYERASKLAEDATEYISFLTLGSLYYDVGKEQFFAVSYLEFNPWNSDYERQRSFDELKVLGQILVLGYGFEPQFDTDQEILQ